MEGKLPFKNMFDKRISYFENGVAKESASFKGFSLWKETCYLEKNIQR